MNMFQQYGAPCIVCRKANNNHLEMKLRRLAELCNRYEGETERNAGRQLNWHINTRCQYGMPCEKLRRNDQRCEQIAFELAPKLVAIAKTHSPLYFECYQLCRGDFPTVCRQLEQLHAHTVE